MTRAQARRHAIRSRRRRCQLRGDRLRPRGRARRPARLRHRPQAPSRRPPAHHRPARPRSRRDRLAARDAGHADAADPGRVRLCAVAPPRPPRGRGLSLPRHRHRRRAALDGRAGDARRCRVLLGNGAVFADPRQTRLARRPIVPRALPGRRRRAAFEGGAPLRLEHQPRIPGRRRARVRGRQAARWRRAPLPGRPPARARLHRLGVPGRGRAAGRRRAPPRARPGARRRRAARTLRAADRRARGAAERHAGGNDPVRRRAAARVRRSRAARRRRGRSRLAAHCGRHPHRALLRRHGRVGRRRLAARPRAAARRDAARALSALRAEACASLGVRSLPVRSTHRMGAAVGARQVGRRPPLLPQAQRRERRAAGTARRSRRRARTPTAPVERRAGPAHDFSSRVAALRHRAAPGTTGEAPGARHAERAGDVAASRKPSRCTSSGIGRRRICAAATRASAGAIWMP